MYVHDTCIWSHVCTYIGFRLVHSFTCICSIAGCSIALLARVPYLEIVHRYLYRLYVVYHYEYTVTATLRTMNTL